MDYSGSVGSGESRYPLGFGFGGRGRGVAGQLSGPLLVLLLRLLSEEDIMFFLGFSS